jgi:hypothetical protein
MPPFRFTGLIDYYYPGTRDTKGVLLGTVEPGAERDLDEAPDRWWIPADGGDVKTGSDDEKPGTAPPQAPEPASTPAAAPSGPQPAPPAVIP